VAASFIPGVTREQLPCSSCTAMCCGPVTITEAHLQSIHEHLLTMPARERRRLARQERGELDCGFLDKETYTCTIYPVRPFVCEAFGHVRGMECPKAGGLVQIMPHTVEMQRMTEEIATPVVALSDRWSWTRMRFE
jgi:Fe-S-cluster containining protein